MVQLIKHPEVQNCLQTLFVLSLALCKIRGDFITQLCAMSFRLDHKCHVSVYSNEEIHYSRKGWLQFNRNILLEQIRANPKDGLFLASFYSDFCIPLSCSCMRGPLLALTPYVETGQSRRGRTEPSLSCKGASVLGS